MNIIDGDKFKLSREVLSAKRRQLVVEHGKGNKPNATRELTESEKDKLFECGESNRLAAYLVVDNCSALWVQSGGTSPWRRIQKQRMAFLSGDMSQGRKRVKVKTSHTLFALFIQLRTQLALSAVRLKSHRILEMNKPDSSFYFAV